MYRRHFVLVVLVLGLVGGLALRARADEDEGKDARAGEELRLGRVAEQVDRDLNGAKNHYQRAVSLAKTPAVAVEAVLALARVHVLRNEGPSAARAIQHVRRKFSGKLSEEQRAALTAMEQRITPDPAPPVPDASPLERKIREMFTTYAATPAYAKTTANARRAEADVVRKGVRAVGKEALPVLESLVMRSGPTVATLAAELYASIGQEDAIEGLERMVVEGDSLIHAPVVNALAHVRTGEATSPPMIAMLDRLLARNDVIEMRETVRGILLYHLGDADLLPRHRAGGPDAAFWLAEALKRKADGAVERALALIEEGGDAGRAALKALLPLMLPSRQTGVATYPVETLGVEAAQRSIELLTADPSTGIQLDSLVQLVRLIESVGPPEAGTAARERAWRVLLDPGNLRPKSVVILFLDRRFQPPLALLEDPTFALAFWDAFVELHRNSTAPYRALGSMMDEGARFWEAIFAVIPRLEAEDARSLLAFLGGAVKDRPLPPAEYDRRWFTVLEQAGYGSQTDFPPDFLYRALARSGDERFLAALRRQTIDVEWDRYNHAALDALSDYTGPGGLAYVEEALADPKIDRTSASALLNVLSRSEDRESRALLVRIASDPTHPHAERALHWLGDVRAEAAILDIARRVQEAPDAYPKPYRQTLIYKLRILHLREGIPYLLLEYERGESPFARLAADAMDAIRDYHERLRTFEAFGDGREEAREEELRRLVDLLADDDPEIRRAAILALAAMKRTDALPRIVALAKDDPDEKVREAALRAVEQMAR